MKQVFAVVALLWQIPFSIVSFVVFHVVRFIFRKGIVKLAARFPKNADRGDVVNWIGFSEMLQQPLAEPYISVACPRWNCHAVIGSVGPFTVKSSIEIQVETANQCAEQWTFVIYYKDNQTSIYLTSPVDPGTTGQKLTLQPGRYSVILRYYKVGDNVIFPAVKIDGVDRVIPRQMNGEKAAYQLYLNNHRNYRTLFYSLLHYHVYSLLKWEKWLPENFVLRGFLPTWNTNTGYVFGSVNKGDRLKITVDKKLMQKASLHLSVFNTASYPVLWETLAESVFSTGPLPSNGEYLVRIQAKTYKEPVTPDDKKMVHCEVLSQ